MRGRAREQEMRRATCGRSRRVACALRRSERSQKSIWTCCAVATMRRGVGSDGVLETLRSERQRDVQKLSGPMPR